MAGARVAQKTKNYNGFRLWPNVFLYRFYVYFAQLHIPSLLCVFRDEYVSQGLSGTAQGGPLSLIPRIKYLRMSGTMMPHSFMDQNT